MSQKHKTEPARKVADFSKLDERSRNELKALIIGKTLDDRIGGLEAARKNLDCEFEALTKQLQDTDKYLTSSWRMSGPRDKQPKSAEARIEYFLREITENYIAFLESFRKLHEDKGRVDKGEPIKLAFTYKTLPASAESKGEAAFIEVLSLTSKAGHSEYESPLNMGYVDKRTLADAELQHTYTDLCWLIEHCKGVRKFAVQGMQCVSALVRCSFKLVFVDQYLRMCNELSANYSRAEASKKMLGDYPARRAESEQKIEALNAEVKKQDALTALLRELGVKMGELHQLEENKEKHEKHLEAKNHALSVGRQYNHGFQPTPVTQEDLDNAEKPVQALREQRDALQKEGIEANAMGKLLDAMSKFDELERSAEKARAAIAMSQNAAARLGGMITEMEAFLTNGANNSERGNPSDGGHGIGAEGTPA